MSPLRVGSKAGSDASLLSFDDVLESEMCDDLREVKGSPSANMPLFSKCGVIEFVVGEVTTAAVGVRFEKMVFVSFVVGIAS